MEKAKFVSTGIESFDSLLECKGFKRGDWVGIVGDPGSKKTVFCLSVLKKWLTELEGNCAIFVTTETDPASIISQLASLKISKKDIDEYMKEYNQLSIIDAFSTQATITSVIASVKKKATEMREHGGNILLIIDSMAPFWNSMATKSREYYAKLQTSLRYTVDLALTTLQASSTTGKSFGIGAEYNADNLIRFWLIENEGEQKVALKFIKTRGQFHSTKFHYLEIDDKTKDVTVSSPFTIKGRFKSSDEALDSMKYVNAQEIQETRNIILAKQLKDINENVIKLIESINNKKDE